MTERILFVDDETRVLQAIQRTLRNEYDIVTADSGSRALELLADGDFAVVVSDMQMPEMNGLQLLGEVKARWPDVVRLMLTGNNDQETAVNAVNQGEVFRFLNKPCNSDGLRAALNLSLKQYKLVTAERELLEDTLRGSLQAVSEILAITKPEIFGATSRIRKRVTVLAERLGVADRWQIDTAAMLCQLGCVSLSDAAVKKLHAGGRLSGEEEQAVESHPLLGAELISNIPRLEQVSNIIFYQNKNYDGSGFPRDTKKGEDIPVGARILKVLVDMDRLLQGKWSERAALDELKNASGKYDPDILAAMEDLIGGDGKKITKRVNVAALVDGMVIEEEVSTTQGVLLVCSGQSVTPAIRQHLHKFVASGALASPILVSDDRDEDAAAA